ncbi:MAG: hypothetical protein MUE44_20465 [Oscillatoriaceae cyanobacterium Prado104]|jgi:hypothetical protein|nr:hypothetical protein [Oscillatoriaceae cyanobacterium Prado104]
MPQTQIQEYLTTKTEPNFIAAYRQNYQKLLDGTLPKRFVVYQDGDCTGWGNKLRGICSAFLLALVTDRILLIDYPLMLEYFEPPEGIEWDFAKYKLLFRDESKVYIDPCHRPEEMEMLATVNLTAAFPETFIIHQQGNTFDEAIVANPFCAAKLRKLFGNSYASRREKFGQIAKFLMQKPSSWFVDAVDRKKQQLGLSNNCATIAVQFRAFYDDQLANLKYVENFVSKLHHLVENEFKMLSRSQRLQFFITTDQINVKLRLANVLFPWGQVMYDTEPVVHTGIDRHLRISTFLKRVKRTLGLQHLRFRKRQPLSAMIDWYILGECDVLISTMTSYAIMAGARLGNQKANYKIACDGEYCGLLTEEEYCL